MERSWGEITKLIPKTEDTAKNQDLRTSEHVKKYEAIYAVEQIIRKVEANGKVSAERVANLTGQVRTMAAPMTGPSQDS